MVHLDYALEHTDWHAQRQSSDSDAVSRWTPYDKPIINAQQELSKLPHIPACSLDLTLRTKALSVARRFEFARPLSHLRQRVRRNDEKLVIRSSSPAMDCKAIL